MDPRAGISGTCALPGRPRCLFLVRRQYSWSTVGIPRRVSSLECLGVAALGEKLKLVNLRHAAMRPGCGTKPTWMVCRMRSRQSLARRTTHELPFSPPFSTPQAFHRGAVRLCERRSASYGMGASGSASVSLSRRLSPVTQSRRPFHYCLARSTRTQHAP